MKKYLNFIARHSAWFALGLVSLLLLKPIMAELRTIFMILLVESLAIALSGVAAYAYTKINFISGRVYNALGHIFTAVHLLVGLVVLGVYIAQFAG